MVDRNIVNKLGLSEEQLDQQVSEMFSDKENEFLETALQAKVDLSLPGTIIKGKIVSQIGNEVVVEVGLKSEGLVNVDEFDDPDEIEPGREIEVLLEDTDSEGGLVLLNKRKADRIRGWETIISTKKEDDTVVGKVIRRIKGGLLVNIGVPVFLPASQVDIRKPGDISRFIGKDIECRILKIDVEGRNIVVSRRKLIEEERKASKEKVLNEVEVGQLRKGVVKNIADFGVFVDLGGVDGLLHISDLSWGRITHPSEIVKLDEEIECIVIGFDKEREKISLGLKQKTTSPWQDVEDRYKIGTRVKGKVVNVMNYGVFLRLEDGIEGLVHISEMSWTRRLNHPSEILNLGDEIEVVVLSVNKERQEISLGLKQTEINPWTVASQKYPPGTIVTAIVRGMTNFGAFVEIEEGISGMVHISDLSWTKKFNHPNEILKKDQPVKCVVLEVDEQKQRVSLGVKQMTEDPWLHAIPEKYLPGQIIKGKVTKITNFGAFVELEQELEGLLHISELADHKIEKPQDIINLEQEVEVKILRVDIDSRKIGLSLRRAQWAAEDSDQAKDKTVADAEPQKPAEKQMPIGVQTVLSGLNLGGESPAEEVDEPKEKKKKKVKAAKKDEPQSDEKPEDSAETEAPAEPEPSTDEVKADVVEDTKPDDAEKAEAEPESDKKEDEPVAKVTEEPQAALDEEEPKTED
ncbi:MAG: 30S ribosomal protein S1 [Planctomycetota bacterium]